MILRRGALSSCSQFPRPTCFLSEAENLSSLAEGAEGAEGRQHCRLTICIELVELTNSETAAATPSGGGARSLRSLSSLETGSG